MVIRVSYRTLQEVGICGLMFCTLLSLTINLPGVDIPDLKDVLELLAMWNA